MFDTPLILAGSIPPLGNIIYSVSWLELGASCCLRKPFRSVALLAAVNECLVNAPDKVLETSGAIDG
jgi:DNA-binding response OmpR family regulator